MLSRQRPPTPKLLDEVNRVSVVREICMLHLTRWGLETDPSDTAPVFEPTCESLKGKFLWANRP